MLSYGGVSLCSDDASALSEANRFLSTEDLKDWAYRTWPGRLAALGLPWAAPFERPVLNRLVWPTGASRFAFGYFLATDAQMALIRPQVRPQNTLNALPLVLSDSDGAHSITTNLNLIAARPLVQIAGNNNFYILTLVDARYYWWDLAATVSVTAGVTSWASLFSALGAALGVTVTTDAVPAAYLAPPADFNTAYEFLPPQLDAAARSVGMKVVVGLDGQVRVVSAAPGGFARTYFAADLALGANPLAGGLIDLTNDAGSDLAGVLPSSVTVVFPTVDASNAPTGATTAQPVTLASLSLPQYGNAPTNTTSPVLRSSAAAGPSNTAQIAALASQMAADWYYWRACRPDIAFAGAVPWQPSGFEDRIEWSHRDDAIWTRVQRPPWNVRDEGALAFGSAGSVTNNFFSSLYVTNEFVTNLFVTELVFNINTVILTNITYNNYDVTGVSELDITDAAGVATITGFSGGVPGQILLVVNTSNFAVTLTYLDAGSLAANRITNALGLPYKLWPKSSVLLKCLGPALGWWVVAPLFGAENLDGTAVTFNCNAIKVNNDLGTGKRNGRLEALDNADGTNTLNWQGFQLTSGGSTYGPEPDIAIEAGTGITIVASDDVGNKRVKAIISASGGATIAHSHATLTADYAVTTTYANSGLSVTLPTGGHTYLLMAKVLGFVSSDEVVNWANLKAKLRDTTGGHDLSGSESRWDSAPATGQAMLDATPIFSIYTAPVNNTVVQLWGQTENDDGTSTFKFMGDASGLQASTLTYIDLG